MKLSTWKLRAASAVAILASLIAGSALAALPASAASAATTTSGFTLGWYAADSATFNTTAVDALPVKPKVVNYYSGWGEGFNTAFADAAYADHVETFAELEPWNCSDCGGASIPAMTAIAAGSYDSYLTSFGNQIRAFGHPVMLTFAHEMNASWYPWGDGGSEHTTPAQWIAAWDHVVSVINAAAPGLVTWIWVPNVETGASAFASYWPGQRYVNAVGLDGYLGTDNVTFAMMFGQSLTDMRALTSLPIWIAETGLNQDATTGSRLAAYVAAAHAAGVTGMLYFNTGGFALTTAQEDDMATAINALPASPGPSTAPSVTYTGTIRLYKMGLCLDDRNNSDSDGAIVQVWSCNGLVNQQWQVWSDGTIRHNGLCLDARNYGTANGTKVQLWACTGGANQKWDTRDWRIHYDNPAAPGKVLDDTGYGGNGTQQQIWNNLGGENQIWATY